MPGRRLCSDHEAELRGYWSAQHRLRRKVLRETLGAFETASPPDRYERLAHANLARWRAAALRLLPDRLVQVFADDWGELTQRLTKLHGECFAVLNMANAHVPGGGYVEGASAQEENIFRRTDCHFRIEATEVDESGERYRQEMVDVLSARDGRVYLDLNRPRVCIRGPEDLRSPDLGYRWLDEGDVFPFFELRAAAQDLRRGDPFDANEMRRRIAAQLDTLP